MPKSSNAEPSASAGRPTFAPPPVLTPDAFHAAIGGAIGKNRIYELLQDGRIRHVRNGSRFLILASEVDNFFEREASRHATEVRA